VTREVTDHDYLHPGKNLMGQHLALEIHILRTGCTILSPVFGGGSGFPVEKPAARAADRDGAGIVRFAHDDA